MTNTKRLCAMLVVLAVGLLFGSMSAEAQLPKEGTASGWYSGFGTFKATPIGKDGKERAFVSWEEHGLGMDEGGKGLLHETTWHCWGMNDVTKGVASLAAGYCVATDAAGDQVVGNIKELKWAPDGMSAEGTAIYTTGTGKFAGISGIFKWKVKSYAGAKEGSYHDFAKTEYSWKLP